MPSLVLVLLLALGDCEGSWQQLTCPYEQQHEGLRRVWCRQTSAECCTGLTFHHSKSSLDGGKLRVSQAPESFTVAPQEPGLEEGVYWCGVLRPNGTIIKLAEGFFQSSAWPHIWSYARWILLPLLPVVSICTNVYVRMQAAGVLSSEQMTGPLTGPLRTSGRIL